jgi:D-hexose-6-phosphate mutarotase
VWNPWIDKSIAMADFGDDEYHQMLCVETANAADDARQIEPGTTHTLAVTYRLEAL